jgi:hypothetical protein
MISWSSVVTCSAAQMFMCRNNLQVENYFRKLGKAKTDSPQWNIE